jgi:TonB family protein
MNPKAVEVTKTSDPPHSRTRRVDAFVVSSDDAFLLELGPVLGDRFRARPAEKPEDLDSPGGSKWLALIDGSQPGARGLVNQIEQQHPRAPLIVVTPDGQQAQWSSALARGTVTAVVPHSQMNGAALQDAIAMAEKRLGSAPDTASASTTEIPALAQRPAKRTLTFVVPGVLILAALAWFLLRDQWSSRPAVAPAIGKPPVATVTAPLAVDSAATDSSADAARAPQRPVLELLSLARVAFHDQDRLLPRADGGRRGDSALELYAEVLAQDAGNDEARDGIRRLFSVARSRMQADLAAGRLDEAQRMLGIFKSAGVDADSARALDADIKAAQPKWYLAQTRRAIAAGDLTAAEQSLAQLAATGADRSTLQELRRAMDARQVDQQLASMGDEAHAAIAAGALLEPAASSARAKVLAMRQLNRSNAATVAAQRELQDALLSRAREALQAQQFDGAKRLVASAAEFGNSQDITDMNRRIQGESDQASARAAAAAAPPPAPVIATAAAATAGKADYVVAHSMKPLSVNYPARAAEQGTQGYVVVEFTLNANGSATEIKVVESKPAGMFERSATEAVSRGKFDTAALGDSLQPRRARMRVSFKPN